MYISKMSAILYFCFNFKKRAGLVAAPVFRTLELHSTSDLVHCTHFMLYYCFLVECSLVIKEPSALDLWNNITLKSLYMQLNLGYNDLMIKITNCKVFLLCENVATTRILHPILKHVDACARCAKKMADLDSRYLEKGKW